MRNLFKNTVLISILTLASRVLGMLRDVLIAMTLGVSGQSDAFFIAFRPFDLVRKLFSEGMLGISFVPVFTKIQHLEGAKRAAAMAWSFFFFLSAAGVLLMLMGLLVSPFLVVLVFPGTGPGLENQALAIVLFRIMLPYFWLVLICALCMGILNAYGQFAIPALAPVLFNLVLISFTVWVSDYFDLKASAIAWGVTAGGLCQLLIQLWAVSGLKLSFSVKRIRLFHPGVVQVVKVLLPCMIGAAAYQINVVVASLFAAGLERGSVSFLYYADRLVQFPLALFAVSTSTVLLPELSRMVASGKVSETGLLFSNGVRLVLFITVPAMAGLMALNTIIVQLLFGRGAFDMAAVLHTSECLFYLVSGLCAFTCIRLFTTLHYAMGSIRVPFLCGLVNIAVNFFFCAVLSRIWGLYGIVLSVSLSAVIASLLLLKGTPAAVVMDWKGICVSACRSLFLSVIMFILVKLLSTQIPDPDINMAGFFLGAAACILSGILIYGAGSYLLAGSELNLIKHGIQRKKT